MQKLFSLYMKEFFNYREMLLWMLILTNPHMLYSSLIYFLTGSTLITLHIMWFNNNQPHYLMRSLLQWMSNQCKDDCNDKQISQSVILGRDFLIVNQVVIRFDGHCIEINNEPISLEEDNYMMSSVNLTKTLLSSPSIVKAMLCKG